MKINGENGRKKKKAKLWEEEEEEEEWGGKRLRIGKTKTIGGGGISSVGTRGR